MKRNGACVVPFGLTMVLVAAANTGTMVLDPLAGGLSAYPHYLGHSCGGVQFTVGAISFDFANNAVTRLRAYTSCSTGGRGAKPRRYVACWEVTFSPAGAILSRTQYASGTWLQGNAPHDCSTNVSSSSVGTQDSTFVPSSIPTWVAPL